MKERPILFSGPMVRALLDGTKTQTRRVVKDVNPTLLASNPEPHHIASALRCPYGQPGDRLWVRETIRAEELHRPQTERAATRKEREAYGRIKVVELDELDGADGVRYLADNHWRKIENTAEAGERWSDLYHYRGRGKNGIGNTVPGIHMPRWACRLVLEVKDIRVERLQDISESDAKAEGAEQIHFDHGSAADRGLIDLPLMEVDHSYRNGYAVLWEQINGLDSWKVNPWVWVMEFKRTTGERT